VRVAASLLPAVVGQARAKDLVLTGRTIDAAGLDLLFKEARTHNKWHDKPITDETLHELYDILKFGPTSANSSPARFVFVRTKEGKDKLAPALSSGNMEKTLTAPVTVIVAYDPQKKIG